MLDDDLPAPPERLFKYLPRARADVIENLQIRFTPLLAANDIFEVRRTFKKMAGPKFSQLLSEQSVNIDPEKTATEEIMKTTGLDEKRARELAVNLLTQKFGPNYKSSLQQFVRGLTTNVVVPTMNRDDTIEKVLTDVGGGLVALSLSEDPKNSTMWTHYAEQGLGFLVEFDSAHSIFSKSPKTGKDRRLQMVHYFDGQLDELMDDPLKALVSKTTNWAYEKEWRLVVQPDEADKVLSVGPDPVHLFSLPPSCITRIIIGYKAQTDFVENLKTLVTKKIPHAKIQKLLVNRFAGTFSEEEN